MEDVIANLLNEIMVEETSFEKQIKRTLELCKRLKVQEGEHMKTTDSDFCRGMSMGTILTWKSVISWLESDLRIYVKKSKGE